MEYNNFGELAGHADVRLEPAFISRPLAKHERLERWAMLLARDPEQQLASVEEVEYGHGPPATGEARRSRRCRWRSPTPFCASRASRATGSAMPLASSSCRTGKSINWSARAITDARCRRVPRRCACARSQAGGTAHHRRAPDGSLPASRPRRWRWSWRSSDAGGHRPGRPPLTPRGGTSAGCAIAGRSLAWCNRCRGGHRAAAERAPRRSDRTPRDAARRHQAADEWRWVHEARARWARTAAAQTQRSARPRDRPAYRLPRSGAESRTPPGETPPPGIRLRTPPRRVRLMGARTATTRQDAPQSLDRRASKSY